jgi:hypothetical protein
MAGANNLENLIVCTVERMLASRYSERHGLVTSYDPDNYLAKVTLQPYGQKTGWLPVETGHIGQTYGIAMGLQPGDGGDQMGGASGAGGGSGGSGNGSGGQQQDTKGDQVIVRFQQDDFDCGKIVQRVHSKKDKPPKSIQSGEIMQWTKFKKDEDSGPDAAKDGTGGTGCKIYHKNDGSLLIEDGNGASRKMDGNGNQTVTSGNKQKTTKILHQIVQDNPGLEDTQQQQQQQQPIHYSQLEKEKGAKVAVFQEKHYTNWDQSGVTHSSQTANVTMQAPQGQVVSQAQQIPHIGPSNFTDIVQVTKFVTASGYNTTSDIRLKFNIRDFRPMLDDVCRLHVRAFQKYAVVIDKDGEQTKTERHSRSFGLIAQEAERVLPEVVHGDEKRGYLGVDEGKVAIALLRAFQEFVRETREEIANLKAQLDARPVA